MNPKLNEGRLQVTLNKTEVKVLERARAIGELLKACQQPAGAALIGACDWALGRKAETEE